MFNINWGLFKTEIGLVLFTLACLIADIFLKEDENRGKKMANIALFAVVLLWVQLLFDWGHFGTAFGGSFILDRLAVFFKGLFLVAGFFTLFMAREYQTSLKRGHSEFTLLILFSLIGMMFIASANDFLLLFVALETMTVSFYIMTAYLRDQHASIEAGAKYLILGALSTAIFLYGLSFIYGATGSTSFAAIQHTWANGVPLPASFILGMILVICSLSFKIAAVPFQLWVPDIYQGAPTPVTAYLAIGSKIAGFAVLVRLLWTVFSPAVGAWGLLFGILSALTILYGNLGAIPQTNIKRLLGYSSIGHAGYLLIGLAAFQHQGKEALLYYLLSYLFSTGGAFLVIIALSRHLKTDEIQELAGLSKKSPILAAGMLLALLSLAGVPPLAGFFAKFYLLWASVKAGMLWLAIVGVINVITSLYYYLKIVKVMYIDKPADENPLKVSLDQKILQYVSIFGILFLGVIPGPFVNLVEQVFIHFSR